MNPILLNVLRKAGKALLVALASMILAMLILVQQHYVPEEGWQEAIWQVALAPAIGVAIEALRRWLKYDPSKDPKSPRYLPTSPPRR